MQIESQPEGLEVKFLFLVRVRFKPYFIVSSVYREKKKKNGHDDYGRDCVSDECLSSVMVLLHSNGHPSVCSANFMLAVA